METIEIKENGLALIVKMDEWTNGKLVYFGREENIPAELPALDINHSIVSIQAGRNGTDEYDIWGAKQNVSNPGSHFSFITHRDTTNKDGRKVEIDLKTEPLAITIHWQFYSGIPIVRSWVEVRNNGNEPIGLERVSSFFFHGLGRAGAKMWTEKSVLHVCHNSWCSEMRWRSADIREYGLDRARDFTSNRIKIGNTGTWSTKDYLPMGVYENTESDESTFWQIENNGSWSWEIGDANNQLYLLAQGPNEIDNHWYHKLQPGASFTSVPAAVGIVKGGFNEAIAALTKYRRKIVQPHWDHEKLPVVFNDYMNCLFADPTTEKELPYIKTAQEMGAEIYVIDAGWYASKGESWWTAVGKWEPSPDRFDGGLTAMLKTIREHGMAPGLWLELEVMGVDCPLVKEWPVEVSSAATACPSSTGAATNLIFAIPL